MPIRVALRWVDLGLLAVLAGVVGGCGQAPEVAVTTVQRGDLRESFTEPGRTRLVRTVPVAMPVTAPLGEVSLRAGDTVVAGQQVAVVDTVALARAVEVVAAQVRDLEVALRLNALAAIESTMRTELEATVQAGLEALQAADEQIRAQSVRADYALREQARRQALDQSNSVSKQALDEAAMAAQTAQIALREAQFTREALDTVFTAVRLGPIYVDHWLARKAVERGGIEARLQGARARLAIARHELARAQLVIAEPGLVLVRHEQGARVVRAGTVVVETGRLADLEVVAEVLSDDALRIAPGLRAALVADPWPEPRPSTVVRIEPLAFTKHSSLGVEQQRVRVILEAPADSGLGVGYRVEVTFVTATRSDVLYVPRESLVRSEQGRVGVYRVVSGRARWQPVQTGIGSDYLVEIRSGLDESDRIVVSPDGSISDNLRVNPTDLP